MLFKKLVIKSKDMYFPSHTKSWINSEYKNLQVFCGINLTLKLI